jgi:hypothetical protein
VQSRWFPGGSPRIQNHWPIIYAGRCAHSTRGTSYRWPCEAAAGGAAKWCTRASPPRGQRGILHGCFRVKCGSAQTAHVGVSAVHRVVGWPYVQAAATAACGGEVVPQTDLAAEGVERGPSTTSFIVSWPTSAIATEDASFPTLLDSVVCMTEDWNFQAFLR